MKTFYDTLGVDRHASFSDIERTYRHSLNEHIADNCDRPLHKKDQLRLREMRQAYLMLSSPDRRLEYDLKLNRMEHARLRMIERVGTGLGVVLLVAGLTLIGRGYYLQVHADSSATQFAQQASVTTSAMQDNEVLASSGSGKAGTPD